MHGIVIHESVNSVVRRFSPTCEHALAKWYHDHEVGELSVFLVGKTGSETEVEIKIEIRRTINGDEISPKFQYNIFPHDDGDLPDKKGDKHPRAIPGVI